jgi:hypothetical protein
MSNHSSNFESNYGTTSLFLSPFDEGLVGGATKRSSSSSASHRKKQLTRATMKAATKMLMNLNKKNERKEVQKMVEDAQSAIRDIYIPVSYSLISPEEYDKLTDAFNNYYKLKKSYDAKYAEKKADLIQAAREKYGNISTTQKARIMQGIKRKCIICKQDGGSIFTQNDGIIKVTCGNISQPCGLHIEVNRGKFESLETLMVQALNDVRETKEEIIRLKLDLLFNFITKEEAVQRFDVIQDELTSQLEIYGEFRTYYLNIVDNAEKKAALTKIHERIQANIIKVKDIMKDFHETGNMGLIEDVLIVYQEDIEPLYKKYNELKYEYAAIESQEGTSGTLVSRYKKNEFYLVQKEFSYKDLYMPVELPSVIANNKALVAKAKQSTNQPLVADKK